VIGLLDGEVALYARPGVPIPELTLVLQAEDEAQARGRVERILEGLSDELGGVHLTVGTLDGAVVVSTSTRAVEELRETGGKLSDSDRFEDAVKTAGAPDEYTGLAYVDVDEAWQLIRGYLGLSGGQNAIPPAVDRNIEHVHTLVAFGKQDGSLSTSQAFLEIK
jgi:hypothetical protein